MIAFICKHPSVTVNRVDSTLDKPTPSGWADVLIYITFESYQHVCEIQLVHHKMLAQRETQESHDPHALHDKFKAAKELADKAIYRRNHSGTQQSSRNLTQSQRHLNRPAVSRS